MRERLTQLIVSYPRSALMVCAVVVATLSYGFFSRGLALNTDSRIFLIENDETFQRHERFQELFGEDAYLVVAVSMDAGRVGSVFNNDTFAVVEAIGAFAETHDIVVQVRSLTNHEVIQKGGAMFRTQAIWPLAPPLETFGKLESAIGEDPLVEGSLVSRDGRTAVLAMTLEAASSDDYGQVVSSLEDFLAQLDDRGHVVSLSGEFATQAWMKRSSMRDIKIMLPTIVLVCAVLLWWFLRRMVVVWSALLVVTAASLSTLGVLAYAGRDLNVVTFILPVLLCPLGVADAVHLCSAFFRRYRQGTNDDSAPVAAAEALRTQAWPCFLTTVTTAAGFLALSTSHVRPLQELGFEGAFGVLLLLFFSLVGLPALLALYRGAEVRATRKAGWSTRFSKWAPRATYRWRWPIVFGVGALTAVCAATLGGLSSSTNVKEYFREGSGPRRNIERTDAAVGGTYTVELVFDSGEVDGIERPEFLHAVRGVQNWINRSNLSADAFSLVDYLVGINERLELVADPKSAPGAPNYRYLPGARNMLAQMLLIYDSLGTQDSVGKMVDSTRRYYRLSVRLPLLSRPEFEERLDAMAGHIRLHYPELNVEFTGAVPIFLALDRHILRTVPTSFAISFAIVAIFLFFSLRSMRLWLLALIPNLLPVFCVGALLVALDIPLDIATALVAAVTFGLVVDDTIHFFVSVREELMANIPLEEALARTYRRAGSAIVITSVVLICGFGIQALSDFVPNSRMGIMAATVIALACIADLFIVPAILWLVWPKRETASAPEGAPRPMLGIQEIPVAALRAQVHGASRKR